jgi:hypothetical protein
MNVKPGLKSKASEKRELYRDDLQCRVNELRPAEKAGFSRFAKRVVNGPIAPRLKVVNNAIELDYPNEDVGHALLADALGTADYDFVRGLLGQLANAGSRGREIDETGLNFMVSVVKGNQPRDQNEAMMAAQMAAVHIATMRTARILADVDNMPQFDSYQRAFNALARTFASQLEALKRYRAVGEPKPADTQASAQDTGRSAERADAHGSAQDTGHSAVRNGTDRRPRLPRPTNAEPRPAPAQPLIAAMTHTTVVCLEMKPVGEVARSTRDSSRRKTNARRAPA